MTPMFAICVIICNAVCMTLSFGLFMDTILKEKVSFKRSCLSSLAYDISLLFAVVFDLRNTVLGTLNGFLGNALFIWARYRYPAGKKLLIGFATFILSILDDLLGSITIIPLIGEEAFELARTCQSRPLFLLVTCLPVLYPGFVALIIRLVRRLLSDHKKDSGERKNHVVWLFVRPTLLVVADIWAFGQVMGRIRSQSVEMIWIELLSNYALMIVLLLVSLTYIIQDIRYISQYRRNETLENEKRITDVLLKNMRTFKHNVANMLYGFEGYILSGETNQMQDYYKEIVQRCSLINNENIVMLQNIPSKAVVGLLLHHIDRINQYEIPMLVYVDRNLKLTGLRESEVCEVLGVLLDNALEATQLSKSPSIAVEMRNHGNSLEIVVRNSISLDEKVDFEKSSKPGHEGVGLESVRNLLEKHNAYLNICQVGQYVEAQILAG